MMTRAILCGDFKVEFAAIGDRVRHTVYAAIGSDGGGASSPRWRAVLHSIEGDTDVDWPDSPPLQELHVEQRGGGDVALLVGRAGRSHWSASIGVAASEDGRPSLTFDVACRASSRPVLLGSAYRLADGVRWLGKTSWPGGDRARWRSIVLLHPADDGAWEFAVDEPSSIVAVPNCDRAAVRPVVGENAFPATVRWRYWLRRTSTSAAGH
jgi:hypothetical protein